MEPWRQTFVLEAVGMPFLVPPGQKFMWLQHLLFWGPAMTIALLDPYFASGDWISDLLLVRCGLSGFFLKDFFEGFFEGVGLPDWLGSLGVLSLQGVLFWFLCLKYRRDTAGVRLCFSIVNLVLLVWTLFVGYMANIALAI